MSDTVKTVLVDAEAASRTGDLTTQQLALGTVATAAHPRAAPRVDAARAALRSRAATLQPISAVDAQATLSQLITTQSTPPPPARSVVVTPAAGYDRNLYDFDTGKWGDGSVV